MINAVRFLWVIIHLVKMKQLLIAVLLIFLLVGCGKRTEQELPYAKELQAVLDSTGYRQT